MEAFRSQRPCLASMRRMRWATWGLEELHNDHVAGSSFLRPSILGHVRGNHKKTLAIVEGSLRKKGKHFVVT